MNVPARLTAFAAVLGLAFGGAALAGATIDPTDEQPQPNRHGTEEVHGHHAGRQALSGLAVSDGGYGFQVDRAFFSPGEDARFSFRITDEHGRPVRDRFEVEHEKELHLIVVRRDTAVFQHLHPTKGPDGTWSVDLNLPTAGAYRAYADFQIDGQKRSLATDLFVPGDFQPMPLPAPRTTARTVDASGEAAGGLDVTVEAPGVRAGAETTIVFTVTDGGEPFEALEPYLGAKGHLVALREGDLGYLHVHPSEGAMPANQIRFAATFPTPGKYRLFLQVNGGGEIGTVSYTMEVPR